MNKLSALITTVLIVAGAVPVSAQDTLNWPVGEFLSYPVDTGILASPRTSPALVYATTVNVPGAAWIRLYYGIAQLEPGTTVRMTSAFDNEVQELDAAGLAMWNNTSAYFNGDTVYLEVIAGPETTSNRLFLDRVAVFIAIARACGVDGCGYCDSDDRVPSTELWSGRLMPVGCTGSVYSSESCVVSAGHCVSGGSDNVIQFNVPASSSNCYTNNPPVADQFPITSHLYTSNGVGDDWAVMTTGTNSLGQKPYGRYGAYRPIASALASSGDTVSVWGYGVDDSPSPTRSQTQQTSSGTIGSRWSTYYTYSVDVTYGNSGSGLLKNNQIIGIVTHCSTNCANIATRVDLAAFVAARQTLCLTPINDLCADAIQVFNSGTYTGSTAYAGNDGSANCGSSTTSKDIWYKYTAVGNGTLVANTCAAASYDTVLSVHTGCPGTTDNQTGCNDDSDTCGTGSTRSYLSVSVTEGTTYYIRVSGKTTASGSFTLSVSGPADTTPPTPNPMTFATPLTPNPASPTTAIDMVATTASDPSGGIRYFFDFVSGGAGGSDSPWQSSPFYTDIDLTPNTTYVYRVKAWDGLFNETGFSADASAATHIETPTGVSFGTITANSIELFATGTLTNLELGQSGVYFDSTTSGGDGGINHWVPNDSTDMAGPLAPDKSYTFRVSARNQDAVQTVYSPTASKRTLAAVPAAPTLSNPTINSLDLDVNANGNPATTVFAIQCTATNPADASWSGKYVNAAGNPSATEIWQTDGTWAVITIHGLLLSGTTYTFAVKARNGDLVETAFGPGASWPTALGACCHDYAPCAVVTQATCTAGGGEYKGDLTTCTAHLCCPLMGDMNGDTSVDGADIQGFVNALLAGFRPCADLTAPYDVLDTNDVTAFVSLLLGP